MLSSSSKVDKKSYADTGGVGGLEAAPVNLHEIGDEAVAYSDVPTVQGQDDDTGGGESLL